MFAIISLFHPSLIFESNAGAYPNVAPYGRLFLGGSNCNGKLFSLLPYEHKYGHKKLYDIGPRG